MRVTIDAPAKINLFLNIMGRRSDGYHIVTMVMQSVSLFDEITVADDDSAEISVSCSDDSVPCDETNTAYMAAKAFLEKNGLINKGVNIKIKKNIPSQSGLAGGSADAAAVLHALNKIFDTKLTDDELADIGELVGADVPFCVYGGTMTADGIGTILTPLPDMPKCSILIVKPKISVSTKEAYEKSDLLGYDNLRSKEHMTEAICGANLRDISKQLYNKFEEVMDISEVKAIKQIMIENGALGSAMSGSGSAVFGIFDKKSVCDDCADILKAHYDEVFVAEPVCSAFN